MRVPRLRKVLVAFAYVGACVGAIAIDADASSVRPHAPRALATPTAPPAPSATPPPTQAARLLLMRERLAQLAASAPGRLGICVYDVATGDRFSVRGSESFALGGVAKIASAIVAYRLADQRRFVLDDRVLITRGDLRRGAGEIAHDHPRGGYAPTYWELVRAMLVTGDATANDVVLRAIGGPATVQGVLERSGIRGLAIRSSEAELASDARAHRTFARGGDNVGTPDAVADLLVGLATQRFTLLDSTYELLEHLGNVRTGEQRLRAGLPESVKLAHEPGTSDVGDGAIEATNDAGLIVLPDGRRIAVVALLAESNADEGTREATIANVARAVADAYAP